MQQLKLTVAGRYFKGAGGFPLGNKRAAGGEKKVAAVAVAVSSRNMRHVKERLMILRNSHLTNQTIF
ncbi:MAG: hypothetical protein ACLFPH_01795 [Bacteroidales bacterium]